MFLFLCFILLLEVQIIKSHRYGIHREPKPVKPDKTTDTPVVDWQPLRINFDFSYIESVDGFSIDKLNLLREQVMPRVAETFKRLLKVVPVIGNLTLIENPCGKVQKIPDRYITGGVSADLIIFVTIEDPDSTNTALASAFHCLQDEITRRPLSGYVKFNPNFETGYKNSSDYLVDLTIHEVIHVLAMNPDLFDDWKFTPTAPLWSTDVIKKNKDKFYIVSPMVLEMINSHFLNNSNSKPDFMGLALEDQGGDGTVNSHWEQQFMNTDIMTGEFSGETFISNITLAMFSDSSWYQPNFTLADQFIWGKDQGSDFLFGDCMKRQVCVKNDENNNCIEKKDVKKFNNSRP